ncbi:MULTISPECIES: HpcH/HpaI aldolase/citrate lyase family protein [unclassified Haematobacter]|uniref:HpcH/HpaI aldolase/citrate lyase family protein n=1 Tax=unclassified Haematobacter TaxID=2640585 RepID=UPI0025C3ADB4|nr:MULTISPECIES: CoA ester lyase [unclassified Haematobacter]
MDLLTRPWRSALYMPASRARAVEKARELEADALIFDLEDAVAPSDKAAARTSIANALEMGGFGDRTRLVRINGLDTPWGADDLAALEGVPLDGLVVPKVSGPEMLERIDRPRIFAMIETPAGVLNAAAIAAHPSIAGLIAGTNDLARELRSKDRPDRLALLPSLGGIVLAARAAGVICLDGVYNAFRDEQGLTWECEQGRDLGFDGKTLIHPGQLAIANAIFAPTAEEIDLATRQIAAWEEAESEGRGVAVVDGRIVENLHVATARDLLARAAVIAARD